MARVIDYVGARDVAQACCLEAELDGAEAFIVAVADTTMGKGSRDPMQEVYPDVPLQEVEDRETLLSIDKARRMLGYAPGHSWREQV